MTAVVLMQELHFHPGHVDAGRALTATSLTGDTQLHRVVHVTGGQSTRTKLTRQREPQRVRTAARQVLLIPRHAK